MTDQGAGPAAGWYPDPHQRHEHRYWDGTDWTDQVADGGRFSTDPALSSVATGANTQVVPVAATPPSAPYAPAGPPGPPPATSTPTPGPRWGLILGIGAGVVAVVILIVVLTTGGGGGGGLGPGDSVEGSVAEDGEATFDIQGQGDEVTIEVEGVDDFDPTVTVEDASGDEVGSDDDSGNGFDSELSVTLADGESYEIIVRGYDGAAGDFRLNLS